MLALVLDQPAPEAFLAIDGRGFQIVKNENSDFL